MLKKILIITAILFIIIGFGIIHVHNQIVEYLGSTLIGIGTIYFLFLLFKSTKKSNTD